MDILLTCIFMSILLMVSDGLTVRGPSDPLVVPLGSSVVLPCYVDKALSSEGLEVEWRRTDSDTLVHWFLEGESRPEAQQQEYHDRAHFFTDQIQHGNFSLHLDNLTAEDEGKYTCKVYSQQDSGETVVQIKDVERLLVSGSSHSISASAGEDVTLNCSVDSHITPEHIEEVSWKRTDEDILVLLYENNETLPDSSDEQYRDRVEFFTDEIPKGNFSLRLKSVRSEDKGVYICQVFAGGLSANATVELERLGFSSWHIIVLVFCFVAGLGAVLLLCCLIFCRSENTVTSSTIWNLQISLVFCPNLCMFFAFIFWGLTEGFLHETIFCCALYILRPVMLIWALPYLKYLQDKLKRWTKFSSITGEYAVLTVVVYSVVFTYGWKKSAHDTGNVSRIFFGTCFGFVLLYCLILCGGFRNIKVKGTVVFLVSAPQSIQLWFSLRVPNLALTLLPWVQALLQLLLMFAHLKKSYYRKCMCALLLLDMIIAIYVHIGILEVEKDFFGWTCVILFLQVLRLMVYFDQQGSNPYELENSGVQRRRQTETSQQILHAFHLCHEIMYMFGAVGLVLLNSVTLTAEMILKARNGERVLKDLRVVVFPSECVFAFYFLVLHMHAYWKIDTAKFTHNQRNSDQRHRRQLRTQNTLETLM